MEMHAPTQKELAALPRLIAIVGPTGVGKTRLSLSLARALDAEIINLDSVQIYRGMDIGSAKASEEEREGIPHHLLDCLNPDEPHNVGDFKERARPVIESIHARGKNVLLVGGTNLYLRVLVHGLLEAPSPDQGIRDRHKQEADTHGTPHLHEELTRVDPELAARIHPNDLVRISRGLEIFEQTGERLSELQRAHRFSLPHYNAFKLALTRQRQELYDRIDARVEEMIARGLEDECARLLDAYPRTSQPFNALGYRQMMDHLLSPGASDMEEVKESIQQATRRFAKQQLGWLRSEPGVRWAMAPLVDEDRQAPARVIEDLGAFLKGDPVDEALTWCKESEGEALSQK